MGLLLQGLFQEWHTDGTYRLHILWGYSCKGYSMNGTLMALTGTIYYGASPARATPRMANSRHLEAPYIMGHLLQGLLQERHTNGTYRHHILWDYSCKGYSMNGTLMALTGTIYYGTTPARAIPRMAH